MAGHARGALKRKPSLPEKGKARKQPKANVSPEAQFRLGFGSHPYGVEPLGNLYLDSIGVNSRDQGLGSLRILKDETILDILGLLNHKDLCRLALISKGFYVFAHTEELWRALTLTTFGGDFTFDGCWKKTYAQSTKPLAKSSNKLLKVKGFYSDFLFQSWLCASLEIRQEWLQRDNISRRSTLPVNEFIQEFEEPNRPVILTDAMAHWPACQRWNREYLQKVAGNTKFAAGPVEMTFERFIRYAEGVCEERPLYIFDPRFGEKAPQLAEDYEVPEYFSEDLFSLLGKDRPDYRWLIAGPARSGSSWHIDPNATSAWNAVIRGSKKWILFPPEHTPPGVHPSADGADVATSVSITEWFMNFYDQARHGSGPRPVEGICHAGEILFVPSGWWHLVLNLEDSIAITQNYVSRRNILPVLEFLNKPNAAQLVSGTSDRDSLHRRFKARFEQRFPGELEVLEEKKALAESEKKQGKSFFWDAVADSKSGGFKFGF